MTNHSDRAFQRDCLEILSTKVARGEISRRRFTQIAAMLVAGAPLALKGQTAEAAANELVLVNWGGDDPVAAQEAARHAA